MTNTVTLFCALFFSIACFGQAIECPAKNNTLSSVDFAHPDCRKVDLSNYEMSASAVWLYYPIEVPEAVVSSHYPLGLFLSGNMSATAYLNSYLVGNKGTPAIDKENEIVGPFDWVGYLDKGWLSENQNSLILFMSGHHNIINTQGRFNRLYIDRFENTPLYTRHYAPSLTSLGAMVLAILYLFYQQENASGKGVSGVIASMLCIATLQLLIEISRGFIVYHYHVHFIRLNLITTCSFLFGHCLLLYTMRSIHFSEKAKALFASACLTLLSVWLIDDYDFRAIASLFMPTFLAMLLLAYSVATKKANRDKLFLLVCLSVLLCTTLTQNAFLDAYFYLFITVILVVLTKRESDNALALASELDASRKQAEKLELAIEMNTASDSDSMLIIKSAGRVTQIATQSILYCKAAGDYVELICETDNALYSGSLRQLSEELPSGFLKVHRSFVVNAKQIKSLTRNSSGNGELLLSDDSTIPVSRALFSQTKAVLG